MTLRTLNIFILTFGILLDLKSQSQIDTTRCKVHHDKTAKRDYYIFTDTEPKYPDGRELMMAYIKNHIDLPISCYQIEETAYLQFIIDKKGKITFLKALKPFNHPDIMKEILRAIDKMPKWTPGTCKGKPVDAVVNIPIKFSLK